MRIVPTANPRVIAVLLFFLTHFVI